HGAAAGPVRLAAADHASVSAQAAHDTSSAASRLLNDWPGIRTSGAVVSKGARIASRNTPPAATALDIGVPEVGSKILATGERVARQGMPGAYTRCRMQSAILARSMAEIPVAEIVTAGESTFRNAKLQTLSTAALVGYKVAADVAGKGSLFVITVVAARRLSPWEFGVFGLGTTLGWLMSVVADFGVQMHMARAVAQSPDLAAGILRRWWRIRVAATVASVGLLVAALFTWRAERDLALPLAVFALVYAALSLVEFLNYFYRGLSRTDVESTLTLWQRGATLVLAVGVLLWRPNVTLLAVAMLGPALAALAWSLRFAMGHRQVAARGTPAGARTSAVIAEPGGTFVSDVFPIGVGIVLSALYFRIDVLLVQRWAGTEAVASYNAVFRLVDALRLFPAAVLAVILPALVTAPDLRPLMRAAAVVTGVGVIAAAALWVTADRVVPLAFGAAYLPAVPAVRGLALAFPLLSLNFALTQQVVAWNRQHRYAAIAGIALVANLALNAWLIPVLSIEGAAWATLGTEACLTMGCAAVLLQGPA